MTATTPTAPRAVPDYDEKAHSEQTDASASPRVQYTTANRPALDTVNYKPRTLWSDMSLFSAPVDWNEALVCLKHCAQLIWFPNVFLIILMNSWFLGVNIGMGTTYATALEAPPYNWAPKWAGVAQAGQIVVCFVMLPVLGFGSDKLIKRMAARNGGIHEPEVRLIPLGIPIVLGSTACILFGYAYDNPYKVHWFSILYSYAAQYFSFIAASVAGQTYLLDAYPTRAGAVLILVCACRGLISFGLSYSLTSTTDHMGHLGAYGMYAGVMAALGFGGLALYFFGRKLRLWTLQFVVDSHDTKKPSYG